MPDLTPQNGAYMVAGYVVTAAILVGYTLSLWIRGRKTGR
jgi:hypothetical protein